MNLTKSLLVGASALGLAIGSAWAADKDHTTTTVGKTGRATAAQDSGFAKLDKNKDGYISKAEAVGDAKLSKDFAKFDLNNDGKLNRAEYLAASAKEDVVGVTNKAADKLNGAKDHTATTGSSARSTDAQAASPGK